MIYKSFADFPDTLYRDFFVYQIGCLPIRENVKPICPHIGEKCKAVDKGINANVTVMLQNAQNP